MRTLLILLLLITIPFLSYATCAGMGGGAGLVYLFGGMLLIGVVLGVGAIWMVFKLVKYFFFSKNA